MFRRLRTTLGIACCTALVISVITVRPAQAAEETGLLVPKGFQVELFADDDLAHDVFNLTFDAQGRPVVSGPGYIKILLDTDGDGRADRAQQFADSPRNGAMGMYFIGRDLLCTGDAGLLRYRDANSDDRADGPPQVFLKLKTGGEHDAHAIRQGPDGWFYLICGNTTGISRSYISLAESPVKLPEYGVLMRLSPDLTAGEVLTHGFRNAYDFDFGPAGGLYTFDSDDERDSSLPWYRPTRVFQALPGAHAGWLSRSWKRPDHYWDMPPAPAAFGRGSPTGVATYRHTQFPEPYRGATFVMDWTFGRVFALPWKPAGDTFETTPSEFVTAQGEFGFAPTDCDVAPDGSLYITVGGRGTRGGVYRIRYVGTGAESASTKSKSVPIDDCLHSPQPDSSWARAQWEPIAQKLGRTAFVSAALDQQRSVPDRVRAIEILTEKFQGLDAQLAAQLLTDPEPFVRARVAWSLERLLPTELPQAIWKTLLRDTSPLVRRCVCETLAYRPGVLTVSEAIPEIRAVLGDEQHYVRFAATRFIAQLDDQNWTSVGNSLTAGNWNAALSYGYAQVMRQPKTTRVLNPYAIEVGRSVLEQPQLSTQIQRDAVRLIILGLGDLAVAEGIPPALHSYTIALDLTGVDRNLDPLRVAVGKLYPTGERELDQELSRLLAVLQVPNDAAFDRVLAQITPESSPIDDVHHLLVASQIPVPRGLPQQARIAQALVQLEPKLHARKLVQDTYWPDRISDLYQALVEQDPELPQALLEQPEFGRPGHVLYLSGVSPELQPVVLQKFFAAIQADPQYPWTNDVVFLFGDSEVPAHRALIQARYAEFATRSAAVICLARRPQPADRAKFVAGLNSSQREVLTACLQALQQLPPVSTAEENVTLVRALRRLGQDAAEYPLRDQVVALLQRNTRQQFAYVSGKAGQRPQPEAIQAWTNWALKSYPDQSAELTGGNAAELAQLQQRLSAVDWSTGDAQRGEKLFIARSCHQCHGSSQALGPSLAGVAGRFSREDLFLAIALPDRDVSPRYQATTIETKSGQVLTGMIVYESAEGLILRNTTNQTFRLETDEIESKVKQSRSLMPGNLLQELTAQDLADLYRYLQTQGVQKSP